MKRMEPRYSLEGLKIAPAKERYTFTRFFQMADRYPDRVAIVFLGTRYTYRRLKEDVDRFATALYRLGVGHQDRVMLYLTNSPQWVIANFAIQLIGAVVVPVSPIYTAHEISYMVEDAGVTTVICQDTNFGYVHEVFPNSPLRRIIVTSVAELLPAWKRAFGYLLDATPRGRVARGRHIHSFARLLRKTPPSPPDAAIDPWHDLAYIMYTGGTTGFPKGVPGNHVTEVAYIRDIMEDVLTPRIREAGETLLMVNPLYHIMAKGFFIAAGLNFANTTVLMPIPHIDAVLKEIERYRVRWILGVPALYRMILENDRVDTYSLHTLRYCFCGGDTLPREVFNRWRERVGAPIYQVYGSTEVGHVAYSDLKGEPDPKVIGKPLKSYRMSVVDPETLAPVPRGEVGELLIAADFNIKSYWNKPEESVRSYVTVGGEVFYRMGDFVAENEKGEICFEERTADVIKYHAYRISASEVEAVLQNHPTVIGACVVGVEDEVAGERIKAIVVLKQDARGVTGGDLKRWCKERLAPYKIPHYIEFRDMLPKSKVGKLLRREIRDEERRRRQG
jgi:long-chain acyl-CoA synthetase